MKMIMNGADLMIREYDVLVELNKDPDNWKHIQVYASSEEQASKIVKEQCKQDGYFHSSVLKVREIGVKLK